MKIEDRVLEKYRELLGTDCGAQWYRVDLHVHTPGSADYKFNNTEYNRVSFKNVKAYAIDNGYFSEEVLDQVSDKDSLMAALIVAKAIKGRLSLVAITDHNSLGWYERIHKMALDFKRHQLGRLEVLPGVELTAWDGEHIIALFDPRNYVTQWDHLKRSIGFFGNEEKGSTTVATNDSILTVIGKIAKVGAIPYLPHLDTRERKRVKGESWRRVLSDDALSAIGCNNMEVVRELIKRVCGSANNGIPLIRDSDAHQIEELGASFTNMKMQYPDFMTLKECLRKSEARISLEGDYSTTHPVILGLAIQDGFLSIEQDDWQLVRFNDGLNCVIGGRGVGKSTIVRYIQAALGQSEFHRDDLEFLCQASEVLMYITLNEENYCLRFDTKRLSPRKWDPSISGKKYIHTRGFTTIFRIRDRGGQRFTVSRERRTLEQVLGGIYPEIYLQTEILSIANEPGAFQSFWEGVLERSGSGQKYVTVKNDLLNLDKLIRGKLHKLYEGDEGLADIASLYEDYARLNAQRHEVMTDFVCLINEYTRGRLILSVRSKARDLEDCLLNIPANGDRQRFDGSLQPFIAESLNYLESMPFLELAMALSSGNYTTIIERTGLKVEQELSFRTVEMGTSDIDEHAVLDEVKRRIQFCVKKTSSTLSLPLGDEPQVHLEFNVNSYRANTDGNSLYKSLNELSYGQKNVAILTLVLEGLTNLGHNCPLIIDQPEDQLDNAYISEHLVKNLIRLKGKRQAIIVTHNPNIPISGDAENVLCMMSNGDNGWVSQKGSVDKDAILRFVADYLEGGPIALGLRVEKYVAFDYITSAIATKR
jgi:histidinol phosphatase-like PHP family hydrolase/energy-coupling factor transporter ATP-binding protein EcfA2